MREVVLYMSMSLDGFVGSDREHPGIAISDPAVKQWELERISRAGAHLMGRTSYEEMSSYWPHSDDPYAAPMNDIPNRPFFGEISSEDVLLGNPTTCIQGNRVTHLVFPVAR